MPKHRRNIALLLSDSHAWFNLGLCSPQADIPDLQLNSKQLELWGIYQDGVNQTFEWAGRDEVVVFHMGDLAHGNKYCDDLMSVAVMPQFIAAATSFYPILEKHNVKIVRLAEGTAAHNFGQHSAEDAVRFILKNKFPAKDIAVVQHGLIDLAGVTIDYAHHGPNPGNLVWTKGNSAMSYLKNYMLTELKLGNKPAKLILRGHFHEFLKVFYWMEWEGEEYESWLIVMPPLSLISAFVAQSLKSIFSVSPGVVAVEIVDGQIREIKKFTQNMDCRSKEVL